MTGVSKEDLDGVVAAVAEASGRAMSVRERTYGGGPQPPFAPDGAFVCEVVSGPGPDVLASAWALPDRRGEARAEVVRELAARGWPLAFSGEEMRLKLSLLPESGPAGG